MPDPNSQTIFQKTQERLSSLASTFSSQPAHSFPPFDQLPPVPNQPQGSLWGFFDKSDEKDEIGTLNLLTSDVVRQASSEIRTGQHIQLDWCLSENVEFPGFGRKKFEQKVLDAKKATQGAHIGFDDELRFNTQSGSQWDSLKHFAHQKSGK